MVVDSFELKDTEISLASNEEVLGASLPPASTKGENGTTINKNTSKGALNLLLMPM